MTVCTNSVGADPDSVDRLIDLPPGNTSSSTPATSSGPPSLADRCGSIASGTRRVSVPIGGGQRLSAAAHGTSSTVAVLLHQTNGDGLCGWTSGAKLFADKGIRTLSLDLCGYGESTCTLSPAQQVRATVDWAKAHGAKRVGDGADRPTPLFATVVSWLQGDYVGG